MIAAGSVVDFEQIARSTRAGAWGFTIGSAIFEDKLPGGPDVAGQVRAVLDALRRGGGPRMRQRGRPRSTQVREELLDELLDGTLRRAASSCPTRTSSPSASGSAARPCAKRSAAWSRPAT